MLEKPIEEAGSGLEDEEEEMKFVWRPLLIRIYATFIYNRCQLRQACFKILGEDSISGIAGLEIFGLASDLPWLMFTFLNLTPFSFDESRLRSWLALEELLIAKIVLVIWGVAF